MRGQKSWRHVSGPPNKAVRYGDHRENGTLWGIANTVVYGPDWHEDATTKVVPVCGECRETLKRWNEGRKHPYGVQWIRH